MPPDEAMTPEVFIDTVFKRIIEPNLIFYSKGYFDYTAAEANNDISRKVLTFTNALSPEQRGAFLLFTRIVILDTLSNIFGVIDGSSHFRTPTDEFRLTCLDTVLSGDLQSALLEREQDLEPSIIAYVDSLVQTRDGE